MERILIFVISLSWLLVVQLCFINVEVSHAQVARNAQGDFVWEEQGDSIVLPFTINESATECIVYRSTSLTGPWEVNGRFSQAAVRTGGATEELTPDARLMDLCYRSWFIISLLPLS